MGKLPLDEIDGLLTKPYTKLSSDTCPTTDP